MLMANVMRAVDRFAVYSMDKSVSVYSCNMWKMADNSCRPDMILIVYIKMFM